MNEKTPLTDELLPCPFCGGRAEWKQGHFTGYVMCLKCETFGPNIAKDEAVAAWNTRAGIGTGAAPAETAPQPDRDPMASKSHVVAREAHEAALRDAERLDWMCANYVSANFQPEEMDLPPGVVLMILGPEGMSVSANLRETIDAAIAASKESSA